MRSLILLLESLEKLKERDYEKEQQLFSELEKLPKEPAIEFLIEYARSASERNFLIIQHALVACNTSAEKLLLLSSEAFPLGEIAKNSLFITYTEEAVPTLIKITKSKSSDDASSAYRTLGNISSPNVQKILFHGLKHRSNTVRSAAIDSIRIQADETWTQDIIQAITLLSAESREKKKDNSEAINALRSILVGSVKPKSNPALLAALKSQYAEVLKVAISALGATKDKSATQPLLDLMKAPSQGLEREFYTHSISKDLQTDILHALANIGDPASISDITKLPPSMQTALALAKIQAPEAIPAIIKELEKSRTPRDTTDLTDALIQLKNLDAKSELTKSLESEFVNVRQAAALTLYETNTDCVATLEELLSEPSADIVRVAKTLIKLGNPKGFPALAAAIADTDGIFRRGYSVIKACEEIPGPESRELLLYLLEHSPRDKIHYIRDAIKTQSKLSESPK
ncbi:HEAT repeat domain-containing protein [Pseudomonas sp. F(2018)]|uniref:HEAT repeat domain-containing protein n=1 Tax=Pseudomonas sp. F(2018) TaxID=2502240 RepID=UPI0010F891E4|nr:HEAT repeat domain-containing protein [Pseudomonas sp. F(2018)]